VTARLYRRYDRGDVLAWVESLKAGSGPSFRKDQPTKPLRAAEEEIDE
jgi:hypothetical protein